LIIQWNPALRTITYNGQSRLSRQNSYIFSLKLTRFIRTPANANNGHFSVPQVTLICCQPRFTDTGSWSLHTVYFHCHNYVIIVKIVPCLNNERFVRVTKILLLKKKSSNKIAWNIKFWTVCLSSAVWLLYYV